MGQANGCAWLIPTPDRLDGTCAACPWRGLPDELNGPEGRAILLVRCSVGKKTAVGAPHGGNPWSVPGGFEQAAFGIRQTLGGIDVEPEALANGHGLEHVRGDELPHAARERAIALRPGLVKSREQR